jgi:hypothetical protein
MTRYWKVLNDDGTTYHHASDYRWSLPVKNDDGTWTPGEWMGPESKTPGALTERDLCDPAVLHVCTDDQLLEWLGPAIFEVEVEGDVVTGPDKCGVRKARLVRKAEAWNERTARIFAVECAESVLHLIPEGVERTTAEVALYVARCYADGEATDEELDAAWAAAWDARDAAWAAWAARAAAWAAALDAARAAAWAARDAARNAALDAARAAALDAARAAAWDARDARDARDAAWAAQAKLLLALLEGR